jgi:sulfite reductase (NADPH) flavoprotein alpha-component
MMAPVLPDNAPFTAAQRAWLNGFFAGLLSAGDTVASPAAGVSTGTVAAPAEEDFPWHDPTLALEERVKLAEGRPFERVLMAAMAQLDCGQCGYLCRTYAEVIERGDEKDLSRCVPGGRATSRKLKELLAARSAMPAVPKAAASTASTASSATAVDERPVPIELATSAPLNGAGSSKDTRHVVFRLNGSGLEYSVGDSLGVHATNCPELVAAIVKAMGAKANDEVDLPDGTRRLLVEVLTRVCDVARPNDAVIELLAERARAPDEAARLKALLAGEPDVEPVDPDLLDLLCAFPSARPSAKDLIATLRPLQPRLYSIASSPKMQAGEIHLTVGVVHYQLNGRRRKGVASTFLAEKRVGPDGHVPVFVRPSHGFRLPANDDVPIIMIGPGTGVAPFRAFIEERRAVGASGRNWLFFGERRRATDFLYQDEIETWRRDGLLTRLDLAFSRDQADKIYVQHRLRERGAEVWTWLQDGAHVYVCGDAKAMARDVDTALATIVAEHGAMDAGTAKAYLAGLARDGRYQRDVY